MDKTVLDRQKELDRINMLQKESELRYEECKKARDVAGMRASREECKVLAARAKLLLFKMGKYRYPDDEMVEYEVGQFMPANVYHLLKD